jgi:hypothetical protein
MSFALITLEINDYQPNNFNFETFAFVFKSEQKDFEETINVRITHI